MNSTFKKFIKKLFGIFYIPLLLSKKNKKLKALSESEDIPLYSTTLQDARSQYKFICHSKKERSRANRLFDKEKGTIRWLDRELQPDDVFYDIGANIGLYTIYAAARLGDQGSAIAFEPHIPNASSLIENIFLNKLEKKVQLVTLALTRSENYDKFNYHSMYAAASTSQYGRNHYDGQEFTPLFVEIKHGCSIDLLCSQGLIKTPTIIKIDVDGLEFEILEGMHNLLSSDNPPRTIQVELGEESKSKIMTYLEKFGYMLKEKHWTQAGIEFINQGNDPEDYPHNGIFYHSNFT